MNYLRLFAFAVLSTLAVNVNALSHNLAWPWNDVCSPPQTPYLAFHSEQSDQMLFNNEKEIKIVCQAGLRSVGMTWTLSRNLFSTPFLTGKAVPLTANRFGITIPTKDLKPGFYDIRVTLDTGVAPRKSKQRLERRPVQGVCTFGWKVDKMAIADTRPADFKEFWDKAKAKLKKIPLDARNETEMQKFNAAQIGEYNLKNACLPADYDPEGHKVEEVESCKISFAGPDGGRVYAWLAKPLGKGPFPAILIVPGAGFNARPKPLEHARHGYLAIDIQVHGQDVDLEKYPKIPGYNKGRIHEPIDANYWYNLYLRVVQAVNYLASRPDVDVKRIAAAGGSQGGRLSTVIGSLDKRISAIVPCIAHGGNEPYIRWAKDCNSKKSDGMDSDAPQLFKDQQEKCEAYYDVMNFSPDITCPVMMNSGLIDPISPPSGVFAIFNRISSKDKTMMPMPGFAHDWYPEFDRRAWKWLDKKLNNK